MAHADPDLRTRQILQRERERAGKKKTEVATAMGLDPVIYHRIETGRGPKADGKHFPRKILFEEIRKAAQFLDIPLETFNWRSEQSSESDAA